MKPSELLADPAKWTKGTYAKDTNGRSVDPRHKEAVSFCVLGALAKCFVHQRAGRLEASLMATIGEKSVAKWNDAPERTHAEVLAKLKELGL